MKNIWKRARCLLGQCGCLLLLFGLWGCAKKPDTNAAFAQLASTASFDSVIKVVNICASTSAVAALQVMRQRRLTPEQSNVVTAALVRDMVRSEMYEAALAQHERIATNFTSRHEENFALQADYSCARALFELGRLDAAITQCQAIIQAPMQYEQQWTFKVNAQQIEVECRLIKQDYAGAECILNEIVQRAGEEFVPFRKWATDVRGDMQAYRAELIKTGKAYQ